MEWQEDQGQIKRPVVPLTAMEKDNGSKLYYNKDTSSKRKTVGL